MPLRKPAETGIQPPKALTRTSRWNGRTDRQLGHTRPAPPINEDQQVHRKRSNPFTRWNQVQWVFVISQMLCARVGYMATVWTDTPSEDPLGVSR